MAAVGLVVLTGIAGCDVLVGPVGASAARVTDGGVYGIQVETDVRLPGDRVLLGGTMGMSGATAAVDFYRNDLPDSDAAPPKELPLPAGRPVMVSASLRPSCAASAPAPVPELVIRSRRSGREVVDRMSLAVSGDVRTVIGRWCAAGVRVAQGEFENFVDGRVKTQFLVSNPGPRTVTVTSGRWSVPGATVFPASVTVAPGNAAKLVVHARMRCGRSVDGPWAHGLLTVRTGSGPARPITPTEPIGLVAIECQYYVPPTPTTGTDGAGRPDSSDGP